MAAALQGFRLTARSCTCSSAMHKSITTTIGSPRAFSTTPSPQVRTRPRPRSVLKYLEKSGNPTAMAALEARERSMALAGELEGVEEEAFAEELARVEERNQPFKVAPRFKRPKDTFINMGEDDPWQTEDMMPDDDDDIGPLAHGELERHREMRHYARLAAWEMPMLSKLAKPFVPPTRDMPLRFRYTTYMGEQHPAEKKVVLEFAVADMPDLEPIQREKLKKLAGVRYNPESGIVKMSCEMYETQAQNKRYLGDVVDSLLKEARDPTDDFADVPLDTRHHKFVVKPKFPREWNMTPERERELANHRRQLAHKDEQKMLAGELVDGIKLIEQRLSQIIPEESMSDMVMAGKPGLKGGKAPKRMAVRR